MDRYDRTYRAAQRPGATLDPYSPMTAYGPPPAQPQPAAPPPVDAMSLLRMMFNPAQYEQQAQAAQQTPQSALVQAFNPTQVPHYDHNPFAPPAPTAPPPPAAPQGQGWSGGVQGNPDPNVWSYQQLVDAGLQDANSA